MRYLIELWRLLRRWWDDWCADRRAIATYEAWKRDPSGAVPWEEFEKELEK